VSKKDRIDRSWFITKVTWTFAVIMGFAVVAINLVHFGWDSEEGRTSVLFLIGYLALAAAIFWFGKRVYNYVRGRS
tara:strand:- start:459 stop:686 length:228 start_codon:yes stop_codon:yes gene_type:complete